MLVDNKEILERESCVADKARLSHPKVREQSWWLLFSLVKVLAVRLSFPSCKMEITQCNPGANSEAGLCAL